jgi:hypothetical protein
MSRQNEVWHLLFELQLMQGKTEVNTESLDEWWGVDDFDPEHDPAYSDALCKAKESVPTIVKNEDEGEWNLL